MSESETDGQDDARTLEHLLDVVAANRDKRCAEENKRARRQADEIIRQAHKTCRARMHRHINALREKYRVRSSSAYARNQTMLRNQQQKADRAMLDQAWPDLRDAMQTFWNNQASRKEWIEAAMASALSRVLGYVWRVEYPRGLDEEELKMLKQEIGQIKGNEPEFVAQGDVVAGIRIIVDGTVIDATLEGLLNQKSTIEATMIARIKRETGSDE